MPDVFISYTKTDLRWAEWIAWTLEAADLTTVLQKWDFGAGSNFVLEMQKAASASERTIAVLSPAYLASGFGAPEWAAAFASDPQGASRKLIPVRVETCDPRGLLGQIVYIDLVGLNVDEAREALFAGLRGGRSKPTSQPSFPGAASPAVPFPVRSVAPPPVVRIRRPLTDLDKRRFFRDAFATIAGTFRAGLDAFRQENAGVETDFEADASSFRAEIYVDGKLRANCKVWIGGLHGDHGISYSEGSTATMGSAINETLVITDDLALAALMNAGIGKVPGGPDPRSMSPEEAGHFLWSRFLWRLQLSR